jgi:hypothetical protein
MSDEYDFNAWNISTIWIVIALIADTFIKFLEIIKFQTLSLLVKSRDLV